MTGDKVSIIMPAYNAGKYVSESIHSVLAQSHANWELIVVDDGSTDETAVVVQHFAKTDSRISYHWQQNGKQGKARNKALALATGEYIAFLDADDIWMSKKLETQLRVMKQFGLDLVFGYSLCIDGQTKTARATGYGKGMYAGDEAVKFLLQFGALVISTVLVTRKAVVQVRGFVEDTRIQYCEDWHFWLKLALAGNKMFTDESIVAYYRIHSASAAQVEREADIKFFFALLDLCKTYPGNKDLVTDIRRRAIDLVTHNAFLPPDVVRSVVDFMVENKFTRVSGTLQITIFSLNQRLFRALFLRSVKQPRLAGTGSNR
jgi:teichuronic acid biosynthesis glycosyltransferase TuaG